MSSEAIVQNYQQDAVAAMRAYKKLAEKAIAQLKDEEFFVTLDEEALSIPRNGSAEFNASLAATDLHR